ncbi:GIY-YIG nuclease family protein [Marinospirillum sp.]|uniref:GIY-YIG nuclease family protein n=1 Tax=Marinospirillum sp. TaxID=2183934 RepID=UPI003A8966E3
MKSASSSCWWIYVIRQAQGALYTGITLDVERRFAEHQANGPKTAKALRGRGPLELVFAVPVGSHRSALQAEGRIKKLKRSAKLAFIEQGHLPVQWQEETTQNLLDAAGEIDQSRTRRQQGSKE